ncbi:hypothetical protein GCM10010371_36550 [Streptomyces subrutilus]|uniref:Uncharacterized protein n=1 Tax=Streptomyces subrutilus TaxID=36818 RepID=A0A918QV87_9ACTN|nr:hypothetical protein GCM10010371_36550 [Streptomyces subrutilus]
MAWTCPKCHNGNAITYIWNAEGYHPMPCFDCGMRLRRGGRLLHQLTPCHRPGCTGHLAAAYSPSDAGLQRVETPAFHPCSVNILEASDGPGSPQSSVPDPRLRGIEGRRV